MAASALGGTLRYVVGQPLPEAQPLSVPEGLVVEAWWSGQPASTSELLQKVAELRALLPDVHRGLIEAQAGAAEQTAVAFQQGALRDFLTGINLQFGVLSALGTLAQAPIVTPEAERLGKQARAEGAAALPAGAGGGDILMFFGGSPSTKRFRRIAVECRHQLLDLRIGARGVHAVG